MAWNWQFPDWPDFAWDPSRIDRFEGWFLLRAGMLIASGRHLDRDVTEQVTIEALTGEAVTTSEIEGEILDRASVQSSLRRELGLAADQRRVRPGEKGIAELMVDLYRHWSAPLDHDRLFAWHRMVTAGRRDLREIGRYRSTGDPMQVVSGPLHAHKIHFEAPPAEAMDAEMARFIAWFNDTRPGGAKSLPALTRAGLAHLYFVSIHPFEDGNGRIGRAIAEMALAQSVEQPTLTAMAATILKHRKAYYGALETVNRTNHVTSWLAWFAEIVLEAQDRAIRTVNFLVEKAKLLDRLRCRLNQRQEKALLRVMREGPDGFAGGLSAGNYRGITGASPATATRDLADLVAMGALRREGELRHARYHLNMPDRPVVEGAADAPRTGD